MLREEIERDLARKRQATHKEGDMYRTGSGELPEGLGRVRGIIAEEVGFSSGQQYERAKEMVENLDAGQATIGGALRTLEAETVIQRPRLVPAAGVETHATPWVGSGQKRYREERPMTTTDYILKLNKEVKDLFALLRVAQQVDIHETRGWPVVRHLLKVLVNWVTEYLREVEDDSDGSRTQEYDLQAEKLLRDSEEGV